MSSFYQKYLIKRKINLQIIRLQVDLPPRTVLLIVIEFK